MNKALLIGGVVIGGAVIAYMVYNQQQAMTGTTAANTTPITDAGGSTTTVAQPGIDPSTGQPYYMEMDPTTGVSYAGEIDPTTGETYLQEGQAQSAALSLPTYGAANPSYPYNPEIGLPLNMTPYAHATALQNPYYEEAYQRQLEKRYESLYGDGRKPRRKKHRGGAGTDAGIDTTSLDAANSASDASSD